jgi:hypothetical protein
MWVLWKYIYLNVDRFDIIHKMGNEVKTLIKIKPVDVEQWLGKTVRALAIWTIVQLIKICDSGYFTSRLFIFWVHAILKRCTANTHHLIFDQVRYPVLSHLVTYIMSAKLLITAFHVISSLRRTYHLQHMYNGFWVMKMILLKLIVYHWHHN